jgi:hypothetical protein
MQLFILHSPKINDPKADFQDFAPCSQDFGSFIMVALALD